MVRTKPITEKDGAALTVRPSRSHEQEAIEALVAATAPAILRLLDDGVPRSKRTIIQALAASHAKADLTRTLMRLSVTGRLQCDAKQRFVLPSDPEHASGARTG